MREFVISHKWILGAALLLIIVVGGCYVWYQYELLPYRREAAKAEEFVRQREKNRQVQQKSSAETQEASTDTPAGSDTLQNAEKHATNATGTKEAAATPEQTGAAAENPETAKVRMSPHGFGAVPEMPEGAPFAPFDETMDSQQELLYRVLVKLWNDGDTDISGGFYDAEQGKVYPYYSDVIYVLYETQFNEITGQDEMMITEAGSSYDNAAAVDALMSGNIPSGYTLLDKKEAGINPYDFLNLP